MLILAGAVVSLSLIPGVLTAVRYYQSAQVKAFVQDALEAGTPVQLGPPQPLNGRISLYPIQRSRALPDDDYGVFWGSARYIAVTFEPSRCDLQQGTVSILHRGVGHVELGEGTVFDRSFPIDFRSSSGERSAASVIFPAYDGSDLNFIGLAMDPALKTCVESVLEISAENGPSITPYFLLNPDWQQQPAYLTYNWQ
jgi:hypothetical protein